MKTGIAVMACFLLPNMLSAQAGSTWDDTSANEWGSPFEEIGIPSSADSSLQKAFIYKSTKETPQPVIISLHTWSGNYAQKDPLAKEAVAKDWNYIHPDFRGPNRNPNAMGSALVLSDISDAIRYVLENTPADPDNVHIVGVSGGGYATLAAYMNLDYPVKSFSAWAPISDIEAWYWESVGRKQKYAEDIVKALSDSLVFDKEEAMRRSPLKQAYPMAQRENADLYIYEGIHDGYDGSVPITHSINMYNRLVGEMKYDTSDLDAIMIKAIDDEDLISGKEIIDLLTKRMNPDKKGDSYLFDRAVHLSREYKNIHITIFEGGHEQLSQALELIPVR